MREGTGHRTGPPRAFPGFVTPGTRHLQGMAHEMATKAIVGEKVGMTQVWDEAQRVVDEAIKLKSHNVVGIGIGGDERRAGPEQFREVYGHAANHGLRLTVHAGETVGAESIWGALRELKPDRIGHGLHAIDDPELVRYLAEKQIPVEVCITSNVMTGCCGRLEDHPVRKLFDAGVLVVLNTDDPDMFHTTLVNEYQIAADIFGFCDEELRQLARNSIRASFLPEERKQELLAHSGRA